MLRINNLKICETIQIFLWNLFFVKKIIKVFFKNKKCKQKGGEGIAKWFPIFDFPKNFRELFPTTQTEAG